MKTEDRAQPFVTQELADESINAAIAAETNDVLGDARHVHDRVEGLVAQLLESNAIDRLAEAHVALVSVDVGGIESRDLCAHPRGVAVVVEALAVVKTNAIEGIHRPQVDVIRHLPTAQAPKLLEQEGRRDDGGTRVEGEAVLPVHVGATAGRVEFFKNCDSITARAHANRGGEPAESAADHDRVRTLGRGGECWLRAIECQHK